MVTSAGGVVGGAEGDIFIVEKEMERNQYNYIQTYCAINTLTVNTEYLARIRAQDERREWGEWTELLFETRPLPPGRPTLKKASSNNVTFTWEAPDTIYRYQYCVEQAIVRAENKRIKVVATEQLEWKIVETTTNETACKIRTQVPLNRLRFRVKCCKLDKPVALWSSCSNVAQFASAQPPDPVQGYKLQTISTTGATMEWMRPSGGVTPQGAGTGGGTASTAPKVLYRVFLSVKDAQAVLLGTTKNSNYTLSDLEPDTQYRFHRCRWRWTAA